MPKMETHTASAKLRHSKLSTCVCACKWAAISLSISFHLVRKGLNELIRRALEPNSFERLFLPRECRPPFEALQRPHAYSWGCGNRSDCKKDIMCSTSSRSFEIFPRSKSRRYYYGGWWLVLSDTPNVLWVIVRARRRIKINMKLRLMSTAHGVARNILILVQYSNGNENEPYFTCWVSVRFMSYYICFNTF